MLGLSLLLFIVFNSSCASSGDYVTVLLPNNKMNWRFCSSIDNDLNKKGFCYITKKCKPRMIGKKCKKETLFCKWGHFDCYHKYSLPDKKLISK